MVDQWSLIRNLLLSSQDEINSRAKPPKMDMPNRPNEPLGAEMPADVGDCPDTDGREEMTQSSAALRPSSALFDRAQHSSSLTSIVDLATRALLNAGVGSRDVLKHGAIDHEGRDVNSISIVEKGLNLIAAPSLFRWPALVEALRSEGNVTIKERDTIVQKEAAPHCTLDSRVVLVSRESRPVI
eukprot:GHVS01096240.1.p1 GENE.GHVS01096240.1~~GHVS01096240.1.p1  ORF type:complete len:184 (+),score=9.69 GHVS01096240.1:1275-1826(+)